MGTLKTDLAYVKETAKGHSHLVHKAKKDKTSDTPFAFPDSIPFMIAVKAGNIIKVDELILEDNRVVHTTDSVGQTGLHWCALRGDINMLRLLVTFGIEIDHKDSAHRTALYLASYKNHTAIVEYLLDKEANTSIKTL